MEALLYISLLLITYYLLSQLLSFSFKETYVDLKPVPIKMRYQDFIEFLRSGVNSGNPVPRFLFYSDIVEKLIILKRKFGVNTVKSFQEIRGAARKSYKVQVEIHAELIGFYLQYVLIGGFTWFFLFQLQATLNISFDAASIFLLLVWQILGVIGFVFVFWAYKYFKLRPVDKLIQSVNLFRALILSSRPLSEVIEESRLKDLAWKKSMLPIKKQIFGLIKHLKEVGGLNEQDFSELVYECWDFYEQEIQNFKKVILGIKLIFILFFVFLGFLFMSYSAMGQLGF